MMRLPSIKPFLSIIFACLRALFRLPAFLIRLIKIIWRMSWFFQDRLVATALNTIQFIGLKCSPLVFYAWLLCLVLLFWNHHAPQAPAWIATSLSVVCSGAISLLAMKEPVRGNRYIMGMALVFAFVPAAFGTWATLQPEPPLEEQIAITTVIDWETGEVFPKKTMQLLGGRVYMQRTRDLIYGKLEELSGKEELPLEKRLSEIRKLAASVDLAEFLLFEQLNLAFSEDWLVEIVRKDRLGPETVSVSHRGIKNGRKNIWRKEDLEKALPDNEFIAAKDFLFTLPRHYQIVLPPGMAIRTIPLEGWPKRILILEDKHCRVEIEPRGSVFVPAFSLKADPNEKLFVGGLDLRVRAYFSRWRIGTEGTKQRKEWAKTLLRYLRETFSVSPPELIRERSVVSKQPAVG